MQQVNLVDLTTGLTLLLFSYKVTRSEFDINGTLTINIDGTLSEEHENTLRGLGFYVDYGFYTDSATKNFRVYFSP